MNEVPSVRGALGKPGVQADARTPVGASADGPADQQAFDDALDEGGALNPQQTPATRTAVKRSLDRIEGSVGDQASGAARADVPAGAQATPRRAVEQRQGNATGAGSSRLSGRRSDRPPPRAVARRNESAPARPSHPEVAAEPTRRTDERFGAGAAAEAAQAPVSERHPVGVAPERARVTAPRELAGRETAGREPAESRSAAAAAKPTALDEPRDAATRARRTDGPAPQSTLGRRTGRASEGVAARAAAEATGREPLPGDRETGDTASDGADTDSEVDGFDANPMRDASFEGFAPSAPGTAADSVAPETVRSPPRDVAQVAAQVADRILVSLPEPGAPDEVRITLRESVLDGSDIRISREAGEIRVVFVAPTETAGRLLADHRAVFEQSLSERLREEEVHVVVEGPGGAETSRGDGDGRSRQRYVAEDDHAGDGEA